MRLSAYRIMWIFTFFDLPTETKIHRRNYTLFRKALLKDGFTMLQYSVYIRHCSSYESADMHTKRVMRNLPDEGDISILTVTDKQFENIKHFLGASKAKLPNAPQQLEMF
jgi:CRISPR-associated protein Cas2